MALTPKQDRFCREYLIDLNATQAAIRSGYSARTAESQGSTLLRNPKVSQRVQELQNKKAEKLDVTVDRVLAEYAKIAFFDPSKIFKSDKHGDPYIDVADMKGDDWSGVSSIQSEDYLDGRGEDAREVKKVKVTLADKKGALDSLAKHLGMFKDKESSPANINVSIEASGVLDKVYGNDEEPSEKATGDKTQ